jgi:hypothetical protein
LPQTALCSLTCVFIADPTPTPILADGTGAGQRAVVLEWKPGVRSPRDIDRDRCEMSGSIESGSRPDSVTPTS